jgi:hypothetical protein
MGGDNFNKNTSESGKKPTKIADKLTAAINAGKKHRESTPERLEKEARKQLNALVHKFIDTYSIVSGIEKAATEGKAKLDITQNKGIRCEFDDLFWQYPVTRKILSVVDKGGSGLNTSKTIRDFGLLLRKEFSPAVKVRFKSVGAYYFGDIFGDIFDPEDDAGSNGVDAVRIYWD